MAGGAIVQLWNEWAIQILILFSFAMQIFLFLFAARRRRGSSDVLMILLWLGYLMADTTAVYTLGHLSISGSLQEHKLLVSWAPFLLVHLGSQDTITAYSLEDNQLWPRHLLNLGVQAFGVAYVLYKHIADIPAPLGLATRLMFIIGVIKYGERIWALKCATLDNLQSTIREVQLQPLRTYYHELPSRGRQGEEEHDEEEILLFAQALLPLSKGAMTDCPVFLADSTNLGSRYASRIRDKWNWKAMCKLVEMELSLMYDILYTKSMVIHTWYGYCIRFFSPLTTIVAFVLFQLSANKYGYNNRVDVVITYILLVGAFLLDMVSVFMAVISTWTCHLLWAKKCTKLGRGILSLRRHIKAAGVNNRGWSGYVRQFNLLHFCSRDKKRLCIQVAKRMGLVDWWNKWYYSKAILLSVDAKELLFKCVWKVLVEIHDPPSAKDEVLSLPFEMILEEEPIAMMMPPDRNQSFCCWSEPYEDTVERRMRLAKALDLGAELQEGILAWHICTDVFLLCSDTPKDARSSTYIEAIKAVSNYMVFLLTIRPGTIPGLELRSIYEGTLGDLERLWPYSYLYYSATRENTLARKLRTSTINTHGPFYARLLLQLVGRNPDVESCSGIISSYTDLDSAAMIKLKRLMPRLELSWEADGVFNMSKALPLILDTWVRLLILASNRCRRDAHARHINCGGGELSTIVWLMEEHASIILPREVRDDPIIFPGIGEAAV